MRGSLAPLESIWMKPALFPQLDAIDLDGDIHNVPVDLAWELRTTAMKVKSTRVGKRAGHPAFEILCRLSQVGAAGMNAGMPCLSRPGIEIESLTDSLDIGGHSPDGVERPA